MRTALFRTATGAPDFDQFRHRRRIGRSFGGGGFRRGSVAGDSLGCFRRNRRFSRLGSHCHFRRSLNRRRFRNRCFFHRSRLGRGFDHSHRLFHRRRCRQNFRQQRRRRRGIAGDRLRHGFGMRFQRALLRRLQIVSRPHLRQQPPQGLLPQRQPVRSPPPASAAAAGASPCGSRARAGSRRNPRRPIPSARSSPASPQSCGHRTHRRAFRRAKISRQAKAGRIRSASRSRISTRTARSPHWR